MRARQNRFAGRSFIAWSAAGMVATAASSASALTIQMDYEHDTFFASHNTARAALEAAASDLSNFIQTSLGATTDEDTGTFGGSSATFNWRYSYTNPSTGGSELYDPAVVGTDEVVVFTGMRTLSGSTLGQGGPSGIGASITGFGGNFGTALQQATISANDNVGRGGGPTVGTFSGSVSGYPYAVDYGVAVGNLWFDNDTDNASGQDTLTQLNNFWHFDHTTPVAGGKIDFYSVALHELLHVLGIGVSQSWDNLLSGNDWLGSEVIALLGSGANVIDGGESHIASHLNSTSLVDGSSQTPVMTPSISKGQRRHLTALDAAFLNDIGWSVVPEPGSAALVAAGIFALLGRGRRRTGIA